VSADGNMIVTAMNSIRLAITVFIMVLIATATTGFVWVGRHQTASQATASRTVLLLCIAAGLIGVRNIWRSR
jgi:hypothetical protein